MDLNISEVSNEHKLFRAGALFMSIYVASIFTFFVKVLRFLKGKSESFIFVVGNNRERGKRSCGKKHVFLLKTPHSLFSPALSFLSSRPIQLKSL